MQKYLFSILSFSLPALLFGGSPNLIWTQTYGEAPYNQQYSCMALGFGDNLFVGGSVYFGSYGNALQNKYGPLGALVYNRMYVNNYPVAQSDEPVALFPDGNGGVTVFGYINRLHQLLHTCYYDTYGNLITDYFLGDTTIGDTRPFQVITSGDSVYYVLGELNGSGTLFKCNAQNNIYWSQPLHNSYNISTGKIASDNAGNIIAAIFDSTSPELFITRFDWQSGQILNSFDTHIDTFAQNDSSVLLAIDNGNNIFISALTSDTAHPEQKVVKFDVAGNVLWSAVCTSPRGYFIPNSLTHLITDSQGNVLINGLYQDYADTSQFAALYKLSDDSGLVLWTAIDSGNYVMGGAIGLDPDDDVYMGTLKSYASTSAYSLLWFNSYLASTGALNWTRSFDNGANNTNIDIQVNYAGDVFFTTNQTIDTVGLWFAGRVGNAAGDAGINAISDDNEDMHVFPNPFSNSTNIEFALTSNQKVRFRVFDVAGNVLHDKEIQGMQGDNLISYKGVFSSGIYLFQITAAEGVICRKAVSY